MSRAIPDRLREQAGWCRRLGSPLYAGILDRTAEDFEVGGPAAVVLAGHEHDPRGSQLALRFLGAVHRIVLEGRAPSLARFYPTAGGDATRPGVWDAVRGVLVERREEVRRLLARPVQTNEVGRSAALLGGFLLVAAEAGYPLRCLEIGAAAGLNLLWDRYRYECGTEGFGDPASPVRIVGAWSDGRPPFEVVPRVVERRGCDLEPIDPASEEGRLALLSYVWPDQGVRVRQLEAALEVARRCPPPVDRASAEQWLAERLSTMPRRTATVVFHSIVMNYLSRPARERLETLLAEAGGRAAASAPLAWLRMEHAGRRIEVRLRLWPGGKERLVALCGAHGRDIRWLGG